MKPQKRSFQRKIIYLVAMAVLLGLLSWLGRPESGGAGEDEGSPGGVLARLRKRHELSQAQLGQIDPASETIRLATLGLRGVAANILWEKANRYKMKKDWTNLSATLKQITKLQPNFISVWRFQAANLSYNISVEFDDWRERYRWVIEGIDFLKEGIKYNQREPRLVWDVGWFTSQKIGGRATDERLQFRKQFKEDYGRDNWLVGKQWFQEAEKLDADPRGRKMKGMARVIFHSYAPMCQMQYAEALETDGVFGERAKAQWKKADDEWYQYGSIELDEPPLGKIRLNDLEAVEKEIAELAAKLEDLQSGLREKIREEKRAKLTEQQRQALDTDVLERTDDQFMLAQDAEEDIEVTHEEVAARITGPDRAKAVQLVKTLSKKQAEASAIRRQRSIVNFAHWRHRAEMEQKDQTIAARKFVHDGDQHVAKADLLSARNAYHDGCDKWREVLDMCAEWKKGQEKNSRDKTKDELSYLVADATFIADVNEVINKYMRILDQHDELFPEDFVLQDFVRAQVEDSPEARVARKSISEGDKAFAEAGKQADSAAARKLYVDARKRYDKGIAKWREVLHRDKLPSLILMSDRTTGAELMAVINGSEKIKGYRKILEKLDELFPEDFVLRGFFRTQVEHAAETRAARESISKGDKAFAEAGKEADSAAARKLYVDARKEYDKGIAKWGEVLRKFPSIALGADRDMAEELVELSDGYKRTLEQLGEPFPEDFILRQLVDRFK